MTQNNEILSYLQAGGKLTALDALEKMRCLRISARIKDLRNAGYDIKTERIELPSGKNVARYFLPKKPVQLELIK